MSVTVFWVCALAGCLTFWAGVGWGMHLLLAPIFR